MKRKRKMRSRPRRETARGEREFAEQLRIGIIAYWRKRGYDIEVWIDAPMPITTINNKHRAPVFAIRSNIGPYGYPPKKAAPE